ncbi:short-chain fatty acid transporter [Elusimicrobiota bacterium]
MNKLIASFAGFTERYIPSAFIIAIFLTFCVFIAAKAIVGAGASEIIKAWGNGFWVLLKFAMQMCIVMLTGFIIAHAPVAKKALKKFAGLAKDGKSACILMAVSSMCLAWVHWGLSLVGSAVLIRFIVVRIPKIHYPLLVTCAYFGLGSVWHAGLSGSAPLLIATPGHFLEHKSGVVPFGDTIFSPWNLIMCVAMIICLTAISAFLYPKDKDEIRVCPESTLKHFTDELRDAPKQKPKTPADTLSHTYIINLAVGATGMIYFLLLFAQGEWSFNLNRFNLLFLMLSILFHPNIKSFLSAAEEGTKTISGIIIQFPLYAGIYGVIKDTGLSQALTQAFISISSETTFPLIVYYYSAFLNYFVPSGGSQWVVEAPYLIDAAKELGVPVRKLVLAFAWGDMVTNLIQPFWCLPLLAMAKVEFGKIMGYLIIIFLAALSIGTIGMLLI